MAAPHFTHSVKYYRSHTPPSISVISMTIKYPAFPPSQQTVALVCMLSNPGQRHLASMGLAPSPAMSACFQVLKMRMLGLSHFIMDCFDNEPRVL